MPREITFGKQQVIELINKLKYKGINSISFQELILNMNIYFPTHNKTSKQLRVIFRAYKNLFYEANIEIYLYEDKIRDNGIKYIKESLSHFKNSLNKIIITGEELQEYLLNKYDFKLHRNPSFEKRYKVYESMNELGMSFLTSEKQRQNTLNILQNFAKTTIVKEYKKDKTEFTIPEIHKLINEEISIASLYNYSIEITNLGIPLKTNKMLKNFEKYSEKDIINKLCSHVQKKEIKQIYAGKISKFSRQLSLPNLGYKKILEYQAYIKDIFDIEVLDFEKNDVEKEKISNTIEENKKYLKIALNPSVSKVDFLPSYNDSEKDLIILQEVEIDLNKLWNEYLKIYITKISNNRIAVRNELIDENDNITINTENKKIYFLLHNDLHINNLNIEDIVKLSSKEVLASDKLYGIHRQNMFLGFLIYLYCKNKLLVSFKYLYQNILLRKKAQTELDLFKEEFSVYSDLQNAIDRNTFIDKELKYMRFVYFFFMTINQDIKVSNIFNDHFKDFDQVDEKKSILVKKLLIKIGANLEIEKNSLKYTQTYYTYIKKKKYEILIDIFNNYMMKKVALKETSIPDQYYKNASSKFCYFFEFLEQYYKNETIDKNFLKEIFNYPESNLLTYQQFIDQQTYSDSSKSSKVSILIEVFQNTKDYQDICSKNQLIKYPTPSASTREAIEEDEIIFKLDEILTNRPPKSDYFNNRVVNMDMAWWLHLDRVVPFEPLIIKLHLRIPSRGKSLREIDKEKLLKYNNNNEIVGFHFISDKNKNRKDPYIVPNIWKSELSFLEQLIQYNNEYFPYLKRYYPSDSTLKNGILPLFPNDKGTSTYPEGQHMKYWTKVLVQAQMEFNNEGKNYNFVYSDEVDIPKTQEEFDNLTTSEFATFKRKYDIHSLRHTGITRNIRAGMPLELVRQLSGHSGFNTILTVYYHVNHQKLAQDWISKNNIDITHELNMQQTSELFIKKEFFTHDFKAKNPNEILAILKEYKFFFPQNRNMADNGNVTLKSISRTDPLFWKPLRTGICTKQRCPDSIIGQCSLCPYFLTNYMFVAEIGIDMQLAMARTKKYSELVISNRSEGIAHKNSKLKQQMKDEIEVFTGYLEILSLVDSTYKEIQTNEDSFSENKEITQYREQKKQSMYSPIPSLNIDHGYLEILLETYKRNINDNETVVDITNIIANKIIKYAVKKEKYNEIEDLNNEQIVKWFLPQYEKATLNWQFDDNKKESLVNLLNLLDNKKIQLEHKNENTFLTE